MTEPSAIKARECRFAIHVPTRSREFPDIHLVKEILHHEDGTIVPNVRCIENYKRPFYVTKKPYQNHKDKKESEEFGKLTRYVSTQSEMRFGVARALGQAYSPLPMKQLSASPYLYGSDVSSTTLIKQSYVDKYPDVFTPYTVATFDIETDVVNGTNDPILATLVMKGKLFHVAVKSFLDGFTDPEERYLRVVKKHLGKNIEALGLEIEFIIVDHPVDLIRESLKRLHLWLPDFVAIWNIGFDIPRLLDTLKKYEVRAEDIFCHPSIPDELRFCEFKKGSIKKMTASGAVKPKNPSEQWHSLLCPCGFWFIDQMSAYRFIRQGDQEEQEYNLNYILGKVLGTRKLEFEEASHIKSGSIEWHIYMQKHHPFEYMAYNNYDSIGTYELELKTKDLSQSLPTGCGPTDFSRFDSQTKRFSDGYYFYLLGKGEVLATLPPRAKKEQDSVFEAEDIDYIGDSDDESGEEEDEDAISDKNEVLSLRGWIVTLKSHMSSLGLRLVNQIKALQTMFRCFTYDSDATAAYPSATAVGNVSKATTATEIIDITGIDEPIFRKNNLNLLHGHVNSIEYSVEMFGLPAANASLKLFDDME